MNHIPKSYLHDIIQSCEAILEYTKDLTYEDFTEKAIVQDAVERNFITIGEALNRIKQETPELPEHITDWQKIIAFRNIVVHGYDAKGLWLDIRRYLSPQS